MKNFLITLAVLVAGGSIFYYFVIFMPRQNTQSQQDINAIRSVIAPTAEQQRVQQQRAAQSEKAWIDYMNCETSMMMKSQNYLNQQCPADPNNPLDSMMPNSKRQQCMTTVQNSTTYKSFSCQRPSY